MAVYAWKGISAAGKNVKGVRDADSPKALRAILKRDGVLVTEVLESAEAAKKSAREINFKKYFKRVKTMDIALATKQLYILLRSGVPLVEALTALIEQVEQEELRHAFTDARDKVNEGISFAEALKAHPKYFSKLYLSLVSAGEASGSLEIVLGRLAEFLNDQARLKGKVSSALAYPAFMAVASLAIVALMMTVVVPKVTAIFEDFGQALPWYTDLLIFTSKLFTDYWLLLIILLVGGVYGYRRWKATDKGRARIDKWMLTSRLVGPLMVKVSVSRFARTLATLLSSGVPVLQAMEITRDVLDNVILEDAIDKARESVREGDGLAKPLKASGQFPPIASHMIAIGEKSGQLEEMLEHLSDAYDQEVDIAIQAFTSVLEPLMILVMGIITGSIAFSILMPLLQISEFTG